MKTVDDPRFLSFAPGDSASKPKNNKCIIYTRVSSKEQFDNNTSIDLQRRFCYSYCERKGYQVIQEFGGSYESAKSDIDRKHFNKMLDFVKKARNQITYIIVYDYSRFSRTGMSAGKLTEDLATRGIYVLSASQDIDINNPSGEFQKNMFLMFSAFDNQMKRANTIQKIQSKLRDGYWCWMPPIGYVNLNKHAPAEQAQIVLNEQGKLIKKAFDLKSQRVKSTDIVHYLKLNGFELDPRRLSKLFKNPFYAGLIVSKLLPNEVIIGKHEQAVEAEKFLEVNRILSDLTPGYKITDFYEELPFKNFMLCSTCEKPYTGYKVTKKSGLTFYYYKCRTPNCNSNVKDSIIEEQFIKIIKDYHVAPKFKKPLVAMMNSYYNELHGDKVNEKKRYENKKKQISKKLDSMEEKYVVGEIDDELYIKYKTKFTKEETEIDQVLLNYEDLSEDLEENLQKVIEYSTDLLSFWAKADFYKKREFIEYFLPEKIMYNKKSNQLMALVINEFFEPIKEFLKE